ncbi:hypothetical protein WICPIJ_000366 [Wickerhamomyces pijperi]|uniref:Uncharacterized protein n=1 Tax=Wickerhamomyces pijperi TaxID=599730 RepID=A0A9P8QGZ3_WICPI|nr:hypothetical protein WICPIJ_000366 [Wickerhamomyces pijperi]
MEGPRCATSTYALREAASLPLTVLLTAPDVDCGLSLTFRLQDFSTLGTFSRDLSVHSFQDVGWRVDVFDFITETLDPPILGSFVQNSGDVMIQRRTLSKNMVQGQLPNLRTHCCLGKLRNGVFGILDTVTGLVGIHNLDVEHTVHL